MCENGEGRCVNTICFHKKTLNFMGAGGKKDRSEASLKTDPEYIRHS